MPILFLCQWKFTVMESDWFNVNESHSVARCLPFVLNTKVRLTALFVIKQMLCFTTHLSVAENMFHCKIKLVCLSN